MAFGDKLIFTSIPGENCHRDWAGLSTSNARLFGGIDIRRNCGNRRLRCRQIHRGKATASDCFFDQMRQYFHPEHPPNLQHLHIPDGRAHLLAALNHIAIAPVSALRSPHRLSGCVCGCLNFFSSPGRICGHRRRIVRRAASAPRASAAE